MQLGGLTFLSEGRGGGTSPDERGKEADDYLLSFIQREGARKNGNGTAERKGEVRLFFRRWMAHPLQVGALLPSGNFLERNAVAEAAYSEPLS